MANPDSKELERAERKRAIKRKWIDDALHAIHSSLTLEDIELVCKEPVLPSIESSERPETSCEPIDLPSSQPIMGIAPGRDGREKVDHTYEWPHSVHGRLVAEIEDGVSLLGSGTMIGPDLVLTSASNVYVHSPEKERSFKVDKNNITFYPAMNCKNTPYGGLKVIEVYYPEEFEDNHKEDYALLVLDRRIGDYTGYFGIKEYNRESLEGKTAYLYGYPAAMPGQSQNEHYLWGMKGPFEIDQYDDMIDHTIDTSPGQAGSALYIEDNGEYHIIGVHIKSADSYRFGNQAVYLNQARIGKIKGWIKDYYHKYNILRKIDFNSLTLAGYKKFIHLNKTGFDLGALTVLKLKGLHLQPRQVIKVLRADLKCLLVLDLSENNIGDLGAIALSQANLANVVNLNLYSNMIKAEGAAALSRASFINLKHLNLSANDIRDEGAAALSQANFPNLTTLSLFYNYIGDAGAIALSKSNFPNLVALDLYNNQIGWEGANSLSQAYCMQLKELNLGNNKLEIEGATALSKFSFSILTSLNLTTNQIYDAGATALSQAQFINLADLNLSNNCIGVAGATSLSIGNFIKVSILVLSRNSIGDSGVAALSQGNFINLAFLDLSENGIGDSGVAALSRANFINLKRLNLSSNHINAQGAIALSQAHFINLNNLYLGGNEIRDEGAAALSRANFPNLNILELSENWIYDAGAISLSQANFPNLKDLSLWSNQIGAEALLKLKNAFPQSRISS